MRTLVLLTLTLATSNTRADRLDRAEKLIQDMNVAARTDPTARQLVAFMKERGYGNITLRNLKATPPYYAQKRKLVLFRGWFRPRVAVAFEAGYRDGYSNDWDFESLKVQPDALDLLADLDLESVREDMRRVHHATQNKGSYEVLRQAIYLGLD